jgi:DNA polymerase IV (archaeal DinB-like DNA polymerase)
MKKRIILHIDLDAFFAQIEERENPQFKGKPIVVGAEPRGGKGRGVVSTANYEARKYGIRSALPISQAWKKCPEAVFLPVNMELYQQVSREIMDIVRKYSDKIEKVSVDEAYLDVSFLKSYQKAKQTAKKLKEEIFKGQKLTSTVGIGPNKMIAKMACGQAKPDGLKAVIPEKALNFLAPLGIRKIPGIGPKTAEKLGEDKTIKDLRKYSKKYLRDLLGKAGEAIYQKVRGKDSSPIETGKEAKSVGKEHTFQKDTRDSKLIFDVLGKIAEDVHKGIKKENYLFKTITVVCRFKGFETKTKSKTLKSPSQNKEILTKEAKKLFLRFIVESPKPIRLVGIRVRVAG